MSNFVWCVICKDQPAAGRMGPIIQGTDQVVKTKHKLPPHTLRVCNWCGTKHEGQEVERNEEDQMVVLKYYSER